MASPTVTVTYEHPGTTPPIFVAGSFTEPAWQAIELDHRQVNDGYIFSKAFNIIPGTHQYKFRVGHGDWWVCDDTKDTETDAAGNVNNIMTVPPSGGSDFSQTRAELFDCGRMVDSSAETASDHCKSPSLGLDGVDGSDEEVARSLRKEVALTENTMTDFHGANDDIEREHSERVMATGDNPKTHNASNDLTNGLVRTSEQASSIDGSSATKHRARSISATSKASAETTLRPIQRTKVQDDAEKVLSQKPSVSITSARNGQKQKQEIWLMRVCRVVVQGVVGYMSTILCGKRRK